MRCDVASCFRVVMHPCFWIVDSAHNVCLGTCMQTSTQTQCATHRPHPCAHAQHSAERTEKQPTPHPALSRARRSMPSPSAPVPCRRTTTTTTAPAPQCRRPRSARRSTLRLGRPRHPGLSGLSDTLWLVGGVPHHGFTPMGFLGQFFFRKTVLSRKLSSTPSISCTF